MGNLATARQHTATLASVPGQDAITVASVPGQDAITVDHGAFKRALARLTSVIDKNSRMPILSHVALCARGGVLEMVGTDLNVYLTMTLATGKGSAEWGTTTPAHKLSALTKTMPGGEIAFSPGESWARVTCGAVSARVTTIPVRDFPKIPTIGDAPWTSADAGALCRAIDAVQFSVCRDETRFHLNGALVESDGASLTLVTTDGHRLTRYREDWSWDGPSLAKGVIIPQKGLTALRKLLTGYATCELGFSGPYLLARVPGGTLAVKLTDAQFPPYEQVIPRDHKALVTVERERLLDALKRAKLVTAETRGARIELTDGVLTVASDNPDVGDVRESLPVEYQGAPQRWGVNPKYLAELLDAMTDDSVTIALTGEPDPCLVRGSADTARPILHARLVGVIMPMRL